jgi:hypothetical protein
MAWGDVIWRCVAWPGVGRRGMAWSILAWRGSAWSGAKLSFLHKSSHDSRGVSKKMPNANQIDEKSEINKNYTKSNRYKFQVNSKSDFAFKSTGLKVAACTTYSMAGLW